MPAPAPIGQRLRRIWPYFNQSPSAWAIAIGATVVASATEPLVPALLQPLLDKGFPERRHRAAGWFRCR